MAKLYHWDLFIMVNYLEDYVSEDVFSDFRAWVILAGSETNSRILRNPESLVQLLQNYEGDLFSERFNLLPSSIYWARYGEAMPSTYTRTTFPPQLEGEPYNSLEEIKDRLPEFWKCFGSAGAI